MFIVVLMSECRMSFCCTHGNRGPHSIQPRTVRVAECIPECCVFGAGISSTVLAASSHAVDSITRVLLERGLDCRKWRYPDQPKLWWIGDCTSIMASSRARTGIESADGRPLNLASAHFVAAISYKYSTNDLTAPSMPCTFGFLD